MRKLLLLISAMFVWLGVFSQCPLPYNDDFESYTTGGFLAQQSPTCWTTWSNLPGSSEDGQISTAFAHSGTKSVLCDELPTPATDQIMKLGNKTTGAYELKWWMYVETGKCGYYNIQHMQSPGIEWAFEVYLRTSGSGELTAGSTTPYIFTYPKATWFEVRHMIDLDNDNIKLYVNGVLIHEWPFHYQADETTGTKQLGGVDFYAGAKTGTTEVPKFFFDDVSFTAVVAPTDPIIEVSPVSLAATLQSGQTQIQQLTVANTGASNLTFSTNIILNSDAPGVNPLPVVTNYQTKSAHVLNNCSADPNPAPSPLNPQTDAPGASAILHYDGDNYNAVGWSAFPRDITVAARFPNYMTLPNAGMTLDSVQVYINDLNLPPASNLMTLKVYGMGTSYEPGPVLATKTFTPVGASWETIVLTSPLLITGQDIWIGYQFTQAEDSTYIPGTDAGPNDPNGDFLSTGVGWSHLSPGITRNWNIRGYLNGTPFPQWLSVTPTSGTVAPGGNQLLDVTFNAANLNEGVYEGIIRILSNDPVTPQVDVPVTLTVVASVCPVPTSLAVTNITSSGASVGWNNTTAPMVDIDYGAVGHVAGTGTVVSGVVINPHVITGLNYLTSYDVYVRQNCNPGNYSPWVGPLTFTTLEQYSATVYPFNVTDGTGYITNVSFIKKGPWMNASATVNDTSGRGYVKFDLSTLPVNAIITKATLSYYYFGGAGTSTAVNGIYSLANDPVTASGALFHTDCGDGAPVWSGTWTGTPPLWFNSLLNTGGKNYISDQLTAGWAGFGFTRTSTSLFRFSGYNDATYKPYLQVEYHVATTPVFSVSPASMDFEQVNLGIQSLPQTFKVKNAGIGTISVDALVLEGLDASQFILTDLNFYPVSLGPGASYTVSVVFKPTSTGVKTASLKYTENETDHVVTLTGTGYLNAPQNLTATPVPYPFVDLAWEAPLPLEEIRYDDNSAEGWYWIGGPTTVLQRFYTKITIPADGILNSFGILCRSLTPSTWTSVSLCPDNGGIPNLTAPIQSYANVPVTAASGEWIFKSLSTPLPVNAGQTFYIVTQWPAGSNSGPSVATDTDGNHYRCGYSQNGGDIWVTFPFNLIMRAYMTVAGDNLNGEPIELTSGKVVDGMQNLPIINAEAEPQNQIGAPTVSVMVPAVLSPSSPNRSLTNYTVHRGTVSGVYTDTFPGISGTTYRDETTAPSTLYYYMVSAEYSNGSSNSNQATVTTFCPSSPAPFSEDFELPIFPPACWNMSTGTYLWDRIDSASAYGIGTGSAFADFAEFSGADPFDLMTFNFDASSIAAPVLKFDYAYATYVSEVDELDVYYSTDAGATFNLLLPMPGGLDGILNTAGSTTAFFVPTEEQWATISIPLPIGTNMIRFTAISAWGNNLFIDNVMVLNAPPIELTAMVYNPTCPDACNGAIDLTVSGGVPPFTFLWSEGSITKDVTGLCAAEYFVTVTDAANTIATGNWTVIDPPAMTISETIVPASCPNASDGSISLSVIGGSSPYSYLWNNGATTPTIVGLTAGQYSVIVTDANNCVQTGSWMVSLASAICPEITVTGDITTTVCYNATQIIYVAGTPEVFIVENGGSATFIAGLKIFYRPGTRVFLGGSMHGYIVDPLIGPWCPVTKITEATKIEEEIPALTGNAYFSIYPNPTNGNFTLVQKAEKLYSNVKVEIYNMNGEKMISASMIGEKQHEFKTADLQSGLYFVRVVADNYVETIKLVKTR